MPEKKPNNVEQLVCSACGGAVLPEDLSEGRARQALDKVFCSACLEARGKSESVRCKQCGTEDVPLFDGRSYLCRKCGAAVKVMRRERPAPEHPCPFCNAPVAAGARWCSSCGSRLVGNLSPSRPPSILKGYLLGTVVTVALIAIGGAAFLKLQPLVKPAEAPKVDEAAAAARELQLKADINGTIDASLRSHKDEVTTAVAKIVAPLQDELQTVRQRVENLEKSAAAGKAPDKPDLAAILSAIKEADRVKAGGDAPRPEITKPDKPNTTAPDVPKPEDPAQNPDEVAAVPKTTPPDATPDATAAPLPSPEKTVPGADDQAAKENIEQTTARLKSEADRLAGEKKFIEAIAMLDSRPDIREPVWQAEREKAKQKIQKLAEELYQVDLSHAEAMTRSGRHSDARDIYRQIIAYGLPPMVAEARKRLDELQAVPEQTGDTDVAPPAEDPRIQRYIAQLRDRDAAQHVRTGAAKELGVLRAKAAVQDLINAMDDRDWFLRVCAASSLAQIGDVRAAPALIRNLKHTMIPVRETARDALTKISGKDFGRDADKWIEWWKTDGSKDLSPEERVKLEEKGTGAVQPLREPNSFTSQVVICKPADKLITFTIQANSGLKIDQKLNLVLDGKKVCGLIVSVIGFGHATAKLVDAPPNRELKAGDMVVIEKIEEKRAEDF